MKVLAASIVNQHPDVFAAFLKTLGWQRFHQGTLDLLFVFDQSDASRALNVARAKEAGARVLQADLKPEGARYAVSSASHDWTIPTFHWLAREKPKILDLARAEGYDAVWLVDSDLLCAPTTLSSLASTDREVVSAVFWTRWQPDAPPLPQVWLAHPYEFQGRGLEAHEFLGRLARRELTRVGGLGACTLIRSSVLDRVAYWPLLDGLPTHSMWQGEDRHFCVRAERNHVELWADPWPQVFHCYRPEDRDAIGMRLRELNPAPFLGSQVSLILEPCEEPRAIGHKEHVRGVLDSLPLAPEIERAVLGMAPGDDRFVSVRFPVWTEIRDYAGQRKLIRVRLLEARPSVLPPTLDDFHSTLEPDAGLVQAIVEPFVELNP